MLKKGSILFLLVLSILAGIGCQSILAPKAAEAVNQIPKMLSLNGPSAVTKGQSYEFESIGQDPDGDKIAYHFGTWPGDLTETNYRDLGWTEYVDSGVIGKRTITWNKPGEHTVCSYCRDANGGEAYTHLEIQVVVVE